MEKRLKKLDKPSKDHQTILQETKSFLQSLKTKMLEDSNANVKDFTGLLSQYKRSVKTLETIQRPIERPMIEKSERNLDLELEINSLKKNIMNKIDEAIVASPMKSDRENREEALNQGVIRRERSFGKRETA